MVRVEQFERMKVNHSTIFTAFRTVRFDFRIDTMFRKVRMRIGKVVYEIAQNCLNLIYGES